MKYISLGCNCHPAYWLRKKSLSEESFPFDWTLCSPYVCLDIVLALIRSDFSELISDDLVHNSRGHVISPSYPQMELYHHQGLLSDNADLRKDERDKLGRRTERFQRALEGDATLIYNCDLTVVNKLPFKRTVDLVHGQMSKLQNLSRGLDVSVYFSIVHELETSDVEYASRHHMHIYKKDVQLDRVWGQEPVFF